MGQQSLSSASTVQAEVNPVLSPHPSTTLTNCLATRNVVLQDAFDFTGARTEPVNPTEEHIEDPGAVGSAVANTGHPAEAAVVAGIVSSPASSPETMKNVPLGPH